MTKVLVISGSSRPGNNTQRAAKFIESRLSTMDAETKVLSTADLSMSHDVDSDDKYTEAIAWADAFVVVSPEYNHSFSGSLKMALDSGSVDSYMHKPAVMAGVSSGGFGGTRVIESLAPVLLELGLVISSYSINFSKAGDALTEAGELNDGENPVAENTDKALADLLWLAEKLSA